MHYSSGALAPARYRRSPRRASAGEKVAAMKPVSLLKCVAEAVVKYASELLGFGVVGGLGLKIGEEVWGHWHQQRDAKQRRAELETLARTAAEERCRQADDLLPESVLVPRCLPGHSGGVRALAFAPDGTRLASGGDDGVLRLWDVGRGCAYCFRHAGAVTVVAFAPDGERLLSAGEDGMLRLWDRPLGTRLAILVGHCSAVRAVTFTADGQEVLSSGGTFDKQGEPLDCAPRLWNLARRCERRRYDGHTFPELALTLLPDGRHVLSGNWDRRLRLWDLETGQVLRCSAGHPGPVWAVAVSPDGERAASASTDGKVRLWDLPRLQQVNTFSGHVGWVGAVAFSSDGRQLLSGGADGTVRLWDVRIGRPGIVLEGHGKAVAAVAFAPEGGLAASGGKDGGICLWSLPCRG